MTEPLQPALAPFLGLEVMANNWMPDHLLWVEFWDWPRLPWEGGMMAVWGPVPDGEPPRMPGTVLSLDDPDLAAKLAEMKVRRVVVSPKVYKALREAADAKV